MMKKIILSLTFFLSFPYYAEARKCAVYGITDSPQVLTCSFSKLPEQKLRCYNGLYYLNGTKVLRAFHMEVESGPVPLVFQTRKNSLTVEIYSPRNIRGTFNEEEVEILGKCKEK